MPTRLRSQQAAEAAYQVRLLKEEILPVEVKQGKRTIVVSEDDHRRPETTMETLEKLPSSFKKDGMVTAGNASGIVDGAAAVVVTREETAKETRIETARPNCLVGSGGRGSQHHGHRSGAGIAEGAATGRTETRSRSIAWK